MSLSNFPKSIDEFEEKRDIGSSDIADVQKYQNYISQGNMSAAQAILERIRPCVINATDINRLNDSITAIEEHYFNGIENWLREKLLLNKGEWSSNESYTQCDIVTYTPDGGRKFAYIAIKSSVPEDKVTPDNPEYWLQLTIQGTNGTNLVYKGEWDSSQGYTASNCVMHNNILYGCLQANTNQEPSVGSSYWSKIIGFTAQDIVYSNDNPKNIKDYIDEVVNQKINTYWQTVYPVGAIYISVDPKSPAKVFKGGTWERIDDYMLIGAGNTYAVGKTYGSLTASVEIDKVVEHSHSIDAHSHTIGSHAHSIGGHTHKFSDTTSEAGSHKHKIPNTRTGQQTSDAYRVESWPKAEPSGKDVYVGSAGTHTHTVSGTTESATPICGLATPTCGATSLTTNLTGSKTVSKTFSILPPCMGVYIWRRTA